ncbi:trypsin-like peptidase domain-containing protein [Streptomyces griseochromogenes]|uniref:trypsin-like peptidase domain-containing protein n=1 Tax=Streptomyces griseochromogenes TaxID=68214 RepID=UPI0037A72A26
MNEGNPTHVPPGEQQESASAGKAPLRPAERAEPLADGDFELAKPAPVASGSAENGVHASGVDASEAAVPGTAEQVVAGPVVAESGPDSLGETCGAGVPGASAAARPKPLHDPDPYSTPPYGEPGPWAPAPPVQHPAAAPAQGTAPTPPVTAHAPAQPTPPAPVHSAPPQAVPAAAPAPAPVPVTPPPAGPAEPGVSTPGAGVAGPGPDAGSVPSPAPAGDPWQGYDPWAAPSAGQPPLAPGPLQQTGAAVLTEQQRRKRGRRMLLVWTLLVAVVSSGIGGLVGAYVEREGVGDVHLPQAGKVPADRAPNSVAGIAARALPSVVTLHVRGSDEAGTGTGFVLDTRGHILTNNHVVQPAASGGDISVTFSSGDTAKARIVGHDSGYDLAVVQVRGVRRLTPMPLGNSDGVRVGDPVVAIGAPFDLANTVTSGIISAKERPITAGGEKGDGSDVSYVDALQTDAPINPGNSGGPLLDSRAEVIGINSAIRSADEGSDSEDSQAGSIGLGFAIPINQAKRVAEELINTGHATHPVIGVTLDMGYTGDGARIDTKAGDGGPSVIKGGPGDRAGLRAGDVITEVDGQRVHSGEELIVKIRAHRPGDRLRLKVEHGDEREVSLVLGASEQN